MTLQAFVDNSTPTVNATWLNSVDVLLDTIFGTATTKAAARTNLGVAIGTDVQAYDSTLTAFAAYNTNGLITQTAADTFTGRTLTGTASQITVTNGDGVSGNPTLSLPADVLIPTILTVPNTGLHILDTNASHDLIIAAGSNLTADRTLTVTTGDADRTLDISATNVTVSTFGASLIDDAAASDARTTLGLGTSAVKNTGTSGDAVPLLNTDALHTGHETFQGRLNVASAVGGTVDAITMTFSPAFTALVDKMEFGGRATGANTSATPTVNPDGLGALTIVKGNGAALAAGDIEGSAHELMFRYNATSGKAVLLNTAAAATAAASQAEQETGTDITKMVTPGRQQYHPSAAKFWLRFNGTGTIAINTSYNITSITDDGVGMYTGTIDTDLSSGGYCVGGAAKATDNNANEADFASIGAVVAGSFFIETVNANGTRTDCVVISAWGFGDLP